MTKKDWMLAVLVAAVVMTVYPPAREALALDRTLAYLDGGVAADKVDCSDTTPTLIEPKNGGTPARSITIKNTSATAVHVGGPSVDTTAGLSVCSSGCDFTNVMPIDAAKAWCLSASGTVSVYPTWGY